MGRERKELRCSVEGKGILRPTCDGLSVLTMWRAETELGSVGYLIEFRKKVMRSRLAVAGMPSRIPCRRFLFVMFREVIWVEWSE